MGKALRSSIRIAVLEHEWLHFLSGTIRRIFIVLHGLLFVLFLRGKKYLKILLHFRAKSVLSTYRYLQVQGKYWQKRGLILLVTFILATQKSENA